MNDLFIYLLKVSAGLGIITLPYFFLFRNDPNLTIKRFYLLMGLVASWIFPLIAFRRPDLFVNFTPTVFIDPTAGEFEPVTYSGAFPDGASGTASGAASNAGYTLNWIKLLIMIYLGGLAFMFLKNLAIILKWNMTWHRTRTENGIAFTHSDQVFTLFTRIFVPTSIRDNADLDHILLHEKAHVRQLHFIDLALMELTLLLTWFNPFSWLISRMIKENHEHLADRQVLSTGIDQALYRAQLLNHTLGVNVFRLGNQFNHSLTFKRFKMMKKPKRSPLGIVKIAFLIPVILATLGLAIGMTPQQKQVRGKVIMTETGEPAIGASVVIAGTTTGTTTDMDGKFRLNVDGDPEIVISFVGYSTIRLKTSSIGKKPLKLEVKTYNLDLEYVPIMVRKTENGMVSMRTKMDNPDNPPVFVVDGKIVKEIDNMDPETIKSINVIKNPDSEEALKYNASHLVLITTKQNDTPSGHEEADVLKVDEETFYIVEDMPRFPGGNAALKTYIYSNLEYPEDLKENDISGEVNVQFLVKASGKLEEIHVASSTNKGFESPALEVFKGMPDWIPGMQRRKPVEVQVIVPVRFNTDTI